MPREEWNASKIVTVLYVVNTCVTCNLDYGPKISWFIFATMQLMVSSDFDLLINVNMCGTNCHFKQNISNRVRVVLCPKYSNTRPLNKLFLNTHRLPTLNQKVRTRSYHVRVFIYVSLAHELSTVALVIVRWPMVMIMVRVTTHSC